MTGHELTPAELAEQAAEAVRSLNHATFPGAGGLIWPGDAYGVVASLSLLAARLPQLLTQLERFVSQEVEAGRVVVDGGEFTGDPAAAIAAAGHWLDRAQACAARLHHVLDQAQQATAYMAASDHSEDASGDLGEPA